MSRPNYKITFKDKIYAVKKTSLGLRQIYDNIRTILILVSYVVISLNTRVDWYYHVIVWGLLLELIYKTINKDKKMEAQLMFYDDHLLVHFPKKSYNFKVWRREYYKIYYRQVNKVEYCKSKKEISIYGITKSTIFRTDKKGKVLADSKKIFTDEAVTKFPTRYSKEINFVKEIEKYSLLRVEIK